ncbi:hypothetical protein OXYTRIMIC_346 [Oxytricha trifallax]|uniref:Uncharacterized protein n=1 Tax=Oxytricha trifallax TaxID=1172189 RepID=A0A073I0V8_9SPIT|nr:hypothetical protein OXYTRIMIC_346 [Oxytricha trifallax]
MNTIKSRIGPEYLENRGKQLKLMKCAQEEEENTIEEESDQENKYGYQALCKEDLIKYTLNMFDFVNDKLLNIQLH